jgi:hypothetical protein
MLAPPATHDFCVSLHRDFKTIVVDKLNHTGRTALLEQRDPATVPEIIRKHIKKEILNTVYGK